MEPFTNTRLGAWALLVIPQTLQPDMVNALVFLYRMDVSPHNNACRRALRPLVIHRKVMGSFRSDWGAPACAALATVLNTAKRNGQGSFQKLVALMGQPMSPFLQSATA